MTEQDRIEKKAIAEAVAETEAAYPAASLPPAWRLFICIIALLSIVGSVGSFVDYLRLQDTITCQQNVTKHGRDIAAADRTVQDATVLSLLTGKPITKHQVLDVRAAYIKSRKANDVARDAAYATDCNK